MNYRTRYRIQAVPTVIVTLLTVAFAAVLAVRQVAHFLQQQASWLPWLTLGVTALMTFAILVWMFGNSLEVDRGVLRMRAFTNKQQVNLRQLTEVEIFSKARSNAKRSQYQLAMRLRDTQGNELWLPLNSWRDEELIMARILRATVECKVTIEGDPVIVQRFTGLLETYKTWDRQQAAA